LAHLQQAISILQMARNVNFSWCLGANSQAKPSKYYSENLMFSWEL